MMALKEFLDQIKNLEKEAKRTLVKLDYESWVNQYLGRKGTLAELSKILGQLGAEVKKDAGAAFQLLKKDLEELATTKKPLAKNLAVDLTTGGVRVAYGHRHPVLNYLDLLSELGHKLGYDIIDGPELETSWFNFDALNIPAHHPAREMWDTYYIISPEQKEFTDDKESWLLRTHTSPVQIREIKKRLAQGLEPPFRFLVPGRVFRREATDKSHECTFYQCEGLVVAKNISLANLTTSLTDFFMGLFGSRMSLRFRPHYYPFVEPGLDVDGRCLFCAGQGCSVCKNSGWLELAGAGLVHPKVIKNMGLDSNIYSGFAFGFGIDRQVMLDSGVNDIRLFYSAQPKFMEQF